MSKSKEKKAVAVYSLVLIAILLSAGIYVFYDKLGETTLSVNGLNAEVGIINSDGTKLIFQPAPLSLVQINDAFPDPDAYIFYRFWLTLTSSGDITNPQVNAIRFHLSQKWNGALSSWTAGTEQSGDRPLTSSIEQWFRVNLPVNTPTEIPIKYRDNLNPSGETQTNLLPFTEGQTVSGNSLQVVRSARIDRVGDFSGLSAGTYTLEYVCKIISIDWQYVNAAGQTVHANYVPEPNERSYVFTITVHADGSISGGLTGGT